MDPTVQAALLVSLFSLCGVTVGAFVGLLGSFLSNWYLSRKQQEQWARDHKAEQERWLRDKLQEIYSNCIYYLSRSPGVNPVSAGLRKEQTSELEFAKLEIEYYKLENAHIVERQKWLNLLMVYHPDRGTPEFDNFLAKFRNGQLGNSDIAELAARDPRLQIDIGKQISLQNDRSLTRASSRRL